MIGLIQNETLYEYDIRSLILAFCIGEKIELSSEGDDNSIYDFICRVFCDEEETLLELRTGESVISEKVRGDFRDKRNFKNSLKAALYRLLSCYFQKELPWGLPAGEIQGRYASETVPGLSGQRRKGRSLCICGNKRDRTAEKYHL